MKLFLRFASLCLVLLPLRPFCAQADSYVSKDGVRFKIEVMASNVTVPWAMVFAPDGRLLFTERSGSLRALQGGKVSEPFSGLDKVETEGELGLMGLALHPNFAKNHLLYLSYGFRNGENRGIRIARYAETSGTLTDRKILLDGIPASKGHAGCRIRFGPDNKLYITTGEEQKAQFAQKLDSLLGKVLRLNDDGTIPADNPFVNKPGARGEIWSYGHRNSQGIDFQPGTGILFETEHGPSGYDGPGGGDELNIIERGKNYGWPVIHHRETHEGMESPIEEWTPALAPGSAVFYRGDAIPQFTGNFLFGCMKGECIMRLKLSGGKVVSQERMVEHQFGRLREVVEAPDGSIYFSRSNGDGFGDGKSGEDQILRLVPQK
jgi:glucose/arabinose dehydrogenase